MVHPTVKFVRRVWSLHGYAKSQELHAFLAYFDDDHVFTEKSLVLPREAKGLQPPHSAVDLYFAPCLFRRNRRRKENAMPGRWLYADLDESDPRALSQLPPTVAWETSRGRYQALWLLSDRVPPEELAELNQRVTYFSEADKGGWSLTKVLRVPGSISTKHGDDWSVRLMWWRESVVYKPEHVKQLTRKVRTPNTSAASVKDLKLPKAPPERILRRYGKRVPGRVRKLIKATEARGDRSERLWQLYGDLLGIGMKPEQVLVVVRPTVWNKYAGQRREVAQLWAEINKAAAGQGAGVGGRRNGRTRSSRSNGTSSSMKEQPSGSGEKRQTRSTGKKKSTSRKRAKRSSPTGNGSGKLQLTSYSDFMKKRVKKPGWMVEAIWAEKAHGVLAGEPKTFKSVISTDLAISVASGTEFLNTFKIPSVGPVILIQEENDEGEFHDRMHRISHSRGLAASASFNGDGVSFRPSADLPIHLLSNQGFDLTSRQHMNWLSRQIRKTGAQLVILDPFYLMTPGVDENSQHQITPILQRLLKLKQGYGVGIQIIHHYRKQNVQAPTHGAQRMSGSSVFHRWFESAVYVERTKDESTVRLVPDHRGHAPQPGIRVRFDLGTEDDYYYGVYVSRAKANDQALFHRLRGLLEDQEEWQLGELRIAMGVSHSKRIKELVDQMDDVVMELRPTGERGRPPVIVRKKKSHRERIDAGIATSQASRKYRGNTQDRGGIND